MRVSPTGPKDIALDTVKNRGLRQLLSLFDDGDKVVRGATEAPVDLIERAQRGEKLPKAAPLVPIRARLAAGKLVHVDVAALAGKTWNTELASRIDHTLLSPTATPRDIEKLCEEAAFFGFRSVCVMPQYVRLAAQLLAGTNVKIACVIGFPAGVMATGLKLREARAAVKDGATELDMVANNGMLFAGSDNLVGYKAYARDVEKVARAARVPVKVILQTGEIRKKVAKTGDEQQDLVLGDKLVHTASVLSARALARAGHGGFLKTCDGVYEGGATERDVAIMAAVAKPAGLGVKASGKVSDTEVAAKLAQAGADIYGTSSGIKLIFGEKVKGGY